MSKSFPSTVISLMVLAVLLASSTPAAAAISVVGGLTREVVVQPGKEYRGAIIVKNTSDKPEEIRVYQTDYLFYSDGTALYGEPGKAPRSNAPWIRVSPSRISVEPRRAVTVHYAITVPDKSDLSGTYWSMLMVETVPGLTPETAEDKAKAPALGIRQVIRYGVQMVTQVGKSGSADLAFQTRLQRDGERTVLQIDLDHDGERWLRPFLWVELYDHEGSHMGRFEAGRKRMYPGTSTRSEVDMSDLPDGTYKALVVADAGGGDVFGATYSLTLDTSAPE